MTNGIEQKIEEYKSLMDFQDKYFVKDYKSNLKFIKWAVSRMIKKNTDHAEIITFIQVAINTHKAIYLN